MTNFIRCQHCVCGFAQWHRLLLFKYNFRLFSFHRPENRLDQCNWQYSTFYFWLAAEDNLAFTLGWFAKFPEYKKNKFYLTGEAFQATIYQNWLNK